MNKSDWLLALIVGVAIPMVLVGSAFYRGTLQTTPAPELMGASYLNLDSAMEPERLVWSLEIDGERRVTIFPDGSVELPTDLPVDDTAWRFWVALGNTWPDFREQMCGAGWGARR